MFFLGAASNESIHIPLNLFPVCVQIVNGFVKPYLGQLVFLLDSCNHFEFYLISDSHSVFNLPLNQIFICLEHGLSIIEKVPYSQQRFVRFHSLGEGYSEEDIQAVIAGEKKHRARIKSPLAKEDRVFNLLLVIDDKIRAKGPGYQQWATNYNLKQMAKTREVYVQYRKAGYSKKRACTRSTGSLEKKCGSIRRHSTIRRCSLIWIETVRLITI